MTHGGRVRESEETGGGVRSQPESQVAEEKLIFKCPLQ